MMFHTPDTSQKRLALCFKRAVKLGKEGRIDHAHPLAAMWSNTCFMLDARTDHEPAELAYDLVLLDYAAERIEKFSADNLLTGDESAQAILREWLDRLFFIPHPALEWAKDVKTIVKAPIGYRYWYFYTMRADGRKEGFNEHFIPDDFGNLVSVPPP